MCIRTSHVILVAIAALLASPNAWAEKADRNEKLFLSAKRLSGEETKDANSKVVEGDVVITQGTMRITAERAVVREFDDGHVFAEIFGNGDAQITFRQKREGLDTYFEAWADRAEFDNGANTLKLFSRAKFKSGGDQAVGEYFFYDTVNEKYELRNQVPNAKPKAGQEEGRVNFVFQPKVKDDKAKQPAGKAN